MSKVKDISEMRDEFLVELCKNQLFDISLFNAMLKGVISNVEDSKLQDDRIIDLVRVMFFAYNKIEDCLISHLNPNDLYFIKSWDERYIEHNSRLAYLIEKFLERDYQSSDEYIDDLGSFRDL